MLDFLSSSTTHLHRTSHWLWEKSVSLLTKIVLSASSEYFKRMFYGSNWKESEDDQVVLHDTLDCQLVFRDFIRAFYTGTVRLTPQNAYHMLTLADKYAPKMKLTCLEVLTDDINEGKIEIALMWMPTFYELETSELLERCYSIICYNLKEASEMTEWLSLSIGHILTILQKANVIVPSEYYVFIAIQNWILSQKECSKETIQELLSLVDLKKMDRGELVKVDKSPLATRLVPDILTKLMDDACRYLVIGKVNQPSEKHVITRYYTNKMVLKSFKFYRERHYSFNSRTYSTQSYIIPECSENARSAKNYTWTLNYTEKPVSGVDMMNFTVTVPSVSRSLTKQESRNRNRDNDKESVNLYSELPNAHVNLLLLVKDDNGVVRHLGKTSANTEMPRADKGIVIDLSIPKWKKNSEFKPDECFYSFEIDG